MLLLTSGFTPLYPEDGGNIILQNVDTYQLTKECHNPEDHGLLYYSFNKMSKVLISTRGMMSYSNIEVHLKKRCNFNWHI
jgi:hypothetical protein